MKQEVEPELPRDFQKCRGTSHSSSEQGLEQFIVLLRAYLHGVGDPGLVGLVSFVFTRWGTQNKRNLPH